MDLDARCDEVLDDIRRFESELRGVQTSLDAYKLRLERIRARGQAPHDAYSLFREIASFLARDGAPE